jgi:hypothetical protein
MSLRRATGVEVHRSGFGIFARYEVRSGGRVLARHGRGRQVRLDQAVADEGAALLLEERGRRLWLTADGLYWDDDGLDAEAVALLAWDRLRRQDARVERLRQVRASEEAVVGARRARIPDEVRLFVWHRDDGRCVRCGAEEDLQFDHVIPVSKGGGNAADNIQVLCGRCNRAKGDAIV